MPGHSSTWHLRRYAARCEIQTQMGMEDGSRSLADCGVSLVCGCSNPRTREDLAVAHGRDETNSNCSCNRQLLQLDFNFGRSVLHPPSGYRATLPELHPIRYTSFIRLRQDPSEKYIHTRSSYTLFHKQLSEGNMVHSFRWPRNIVHFLDFSAYEWLSPLICNLRGVLLAPCTSTPWKCHCSRAPKSAWKCPVHPDSVLRKEAVKAAMSQLKRQTSSQGQMQTSFCRRLSSERRRPCY